MRRLPVVGIALSVALVVTGCSSSPAPPVSPLSGSSALTCDGGLRCVEPGTVRWSLPLPGSSQFDISSGTSVLNMPALPAEGVASVGEIPPGYLATVAVAPGLVVIQQPNRAVIEAIDPATGKRLWTTKLATPPGFTPDTAVSGALVLSMLAADDVITVYDSPDYLWWQVSAATGAASVSHRIASYTQANAQATHDVLPVTQQSAVLLNDTQVQGVDAATGSVRWQVPLQRWTGYAVIGHVLYADNDPFGQDQSSNTGPSGHATALQRVDLATGRLLPDLPLPPDLHAEGGQVVQFGQDPDALLVESGAVLTRIDTATGQPIWTAALPASTLGRAQAGPTGTQPTVEYLVPGKTADSFPTPAPGTGANIWQVLLVSLATGKQTPVSMGRSFPYGEAGIYTGGDGGDIWNLYDSAMLASAATKAQRAGTGGFSYTRLEGVDPQTGRVLWRGPWAADLYVLGETFTGPPEIIAESCAPSGLVADPSAIHGDEAFCDSERLYAINT
jgi:outer membrane protein assembly factor BamB